MKKNWSLIMKKSSMLIMALCMMLLALVACTKKDVTSETSQVETVTENGDKLQTDAEELEKEEVTEVASQSESVISENQISLKIYSSNDDATGFVVNEVMVPEVTPEAIVSELSKVNICSMDTKVLGFEQNGKNIELNLSKQFENYLSMMGTSGEYIVMGSLVNTFLDAYDADTIKITVLGNSLSTGHESYEEPMSKYEDMVFEDGSDETADETVEESVEVEENN